jgi:hypothetical protein|tara:strand:+ start:6786 stop:7163 length:378 start_codon:yes stop_codon:yes gene_type:complete
MITLNDDTFLVYAIKNYNNPECTGMSDFEDDVKRFKYLKRLFNRYETSEVLSDRLIINHLIVLYNVFDVAATTMLFYKTEERHWPILKTFLVFLNRMPMEQIVTGGVKDTDIPLDFKIINILRKI